MCTRNQNKLVCDGLYQVNGAHLAVRKTEIKSAIIQIKIRWFAVRFCAKKNAASS